MYFKWQNKISHIDSQNIIKVLQNVSYDDI